MGARSSKTYTDSYIDGDSAEHLDLNSELRTVPDFLRQHALTKPETESVVFAAPDGSREAVTWQQWYMNARIVAKSLVNIGVKREEIVAISLRPCPEWLYITIGAMMAGARPMSFAFAYNDGRDVIALVEKLESVSLVVLDSGTDGTNLDIFKRLLDSYNKYGRATSTLMPSIRYVVTHNCDDSGFMTFYELMKQTNECIKLPTIDADDIAGLFQTSGSTGIPKLVTHTHESMTYLASVNSTRHGQQSNLGNNDKNVTPTIQFNDRPFTWMGGYPLNLLTGSTRVTRMGTTGRLTEEERVRFIIDVIKRERCTVMSCMSPMLQNLMDAQEMIGDDWPVKAILMSGQPITNRVTGCIGKLCDVLFCIYGGTELFTVAGIPVMNAERFTDHCCGYPLNGISIKIVDEHGAVVPVDTQGTICIRSKGLFKKYYNDEDRTREVMTSDGWFHSDDYGRITKDGVLFVEGRKSEMIICGGQKVMPSVLENVLTSFPGIEYAVCVPIPHIVQYQVVCACVKMVDGCEATEEKLRAFCEEVRNDKARTFAVVPEYFLFMDHFSKTWTGKLSRKDIAKTAQELLKNKIDQ